MPPETMLEETDSSDARSADPKIVLYGQEVLISQAEPVTQFDEDLDKLVKEMHHIMVRANGVGLAAPQIGVGKQVCIVDLSVGQDPNDLKVFINPETIEQEGKQKTEEGCLSFPDIFTLVERPYYVKVRARDSYGEYKDHEAEEFLTHAYCHEIDHLKGILMLDRISNLKRSIIKRKINKWVKAGTWK